MFKNFLNFLGFAKEQEKVPRPTRAKIGVFEALFKARFQGAISIHWESALEWIDSYDPLDEVEQTALQHTVLRSPSTAVTIDSLKTIALKNVNDPHLSRYELQACLIIRVFMQNVCRNELHACPISLVPLSTSSVLFSGYLHGVLHECVLKESSVRKLISEVKNWYSNSERFSKEAQRIFKVLNKYDAGQLDSLPAALLEDISQLLSNAGAFFFSHVLLMLPVQAETLDRASGFAQADNLQSRAIYSTDRKEKLLFSGMASNTKALAEKTTAGSRYYDDSSSSSNYKYSSFSE